LLAVPVGNSPEHVSQDWDIWGTIHPLEGEGKAGITMPTAEQAREWRGADLVDRDGEKIGKIEEIYLDSQSNQPEWALVNTGLFGTKSTFVPIRDASREGDNLQVPVEKAQVKDAPSIDSDGQLSQQEESELYRHYGLDYSAGGDVDERGDAGDRTGGGDDAMTRSEEELRVGTTERESGRVRLRKYVETEEVEQTVPVQREEVRIEREPITDDNRDAALAGPEISEDEHEVVLHEEEVVAEKRTVPKERISLETDQVTDERQVSETLRKEQVDVDDSGRGDR
jgi:uncharacterized protein (TIGR02271 family)